MLCWRRAGRLQLCMQIKLASLRGLFVRWHQWLLRARTLPSSLPPYRGLTLTPTHTHTHKHGQEATDTMVPINTSKPLFIPLLASRSVTFSLFVLVSTWLQSLCFALSRLLPSVLCSVFVYSHSREKSTSIYTEWTIERQALFGGSDSLHFRCGDEGCPAKHALDTKTLRHKHAHRFAHTRSSVWENRDRSQPDLTIAQRKRSIKQQVHFSAEAFKKHGRHETAGALLERAKKISPR